MGPGNDGGGSIESCLTWWELNHQSNFQIWALEGNLWGCAGKKQYALGSGVGPGVGSGVGPVVSLSDGPGIGLSRKFLKTAQS